MRIQNVIVGVMMDLKKGNGNSTIHRNAQRI